MAGPNLCKLLLRRIGAVEYEPAGYLNTTRVPRPGEPFDVRVSQVQNRASRGHLRAVDLETLHTRVVYVAAPAREGGEFTIRLDEIAD
jgi:hypothetical protein